MTRMTRDLTQAQFDAAIKRLGFKPTGFMGYYSLPVPNDHVQVCKFNAGGNRRAQLAYLIQQAERYQQSKAKAEEHL